MTPGGLATIKKAKISGAWGSAYTNKAKDSMPRDLKEALMKLQWLNFQKFANSYRNMYIGWIAAAKTKETRPMIIERGIE